MKLLIAKGISNILSALAVAVEATFILTFLGTKNLYLSIEWTAISSVIILSFLIVIYFFVKKGKFSDLDISTQKQRPLLFLMDFVVAIIYFSILFIFHAPKELFIGNIAVFVIIIVLAIVNKFIKASVHMAMLTGALTLFVVTGGTVFLWGYILVPVLAWARITTKRHTLNQVIVGTIIGILVVLLTFILQKFII